MRGQSQWHTGQGTAHSLIMCHFRNHHLDGGFSDSLNCQLTQRLFPDPPDTTRLCLLFHLITHLQITQETLKVKSSLCCIPIAIGPNVFKSSSRKYTIMIICKQRGKTSNAFTNTGGINEKDTSQLPGPWNVHWVTSRRGVRFRRMNVSKNKFDLSYY